MTSNGVAERLSDGWQTAAAGSRPSSLQKVYGWTMGAV